MQTNPKYNIHPVLTLKKKNPQLLINYKTMEITSGADRHALQRDGERNLRTRDGKRERERERQKQEQRKLMRKRYTNKDALSMLALDLLHSQSPSIGPHPVGVQCQTRGSDFGLLSSPWPPTFFHLSSGVFKLLWPYHQCWRAGSCSLQHAQTIVSMCHIMAKINWFSNPSLYVCKCIMHTYIISQSTALSLDST